VDAHRIRLSEGRFNRPTALRSAKGAPAAPGEVHRPFESVLASGWSSARTEYPDVIRAGALHRVIQASLFAADDRDMNVELARHTPGSNKISIHTDDPPSGARVRLPHLATTAMRPRPPWDTTDPEVQPTRDLVFERELVVTKAVDTRHSMYPLRAVDRVCDIIDLLAQHPTGVTLSTLSSAVSLPKSSAFRYLAALEMHGYVIRSDDGIGYRLGSPIAGSEPLVNGRLEKLITTAKPLMSRLISTDVPVCMLATLDGNTVRYLWVVSHPPVDARVPGVGDRVLLHNNAAGKAIAAQLSDEAVVRAVTSTGMPQPTTSTLGSPTGLLRELHRIRGEGFAMSEKESYLDVRGVAVPIGGESLALSLAGREHQLTPDRVSGAVRQLRRAAVVLARELRG